MGGIARNPLSNLISLYAKEYRKLAETSTAKAKVSFLIAWDFPGSYIPRNFYNHLKALEEATKAHRVQKSVLIAPDTAAANLAKKTIEKFGGEVYVAPLLDRNLLALKKANPNLLLKALEEAVKVTL
ncbi:MAG: hypothetical protein DRJ98_04230 [Thermoprotei archaeon]|nr:MAG: hypothetical protein DRJ98_04230 [Thermoprotei archaeon]RLF14780.1 MAG: hypothetical protein DRN06_06590 [Thermoprotei archaeon]